MYHGKASYYGHRALPIVRNRRTGIVGRALSGLGADASDDLSEVAVTSRFVPVPPPYEPPDEYDIPTIEVSGTRIPWWAWVVAGVAGFAVLNSFVRR